MGGGGGDGGRQAGGRRHARQRVAHCVPATQPVGSSRSKALTMPRWRGRVTSRYSFLRVCEGRGDGHDMRPTCRASTSSRLRRGLLGGNGLCGGLATSVAIGSAVSAFWSLCVLFGSTASQLTGLAPPVVGPAGRSFTVVAAPVSRAGVATRAATLARSEPLNLSD